MARGLQGLLDGNVTAFRETMTSGTATTTPDAIYGIRCGETSMRHDSFEDLRPLLQQVDELSGWGGFDFGTINPIRCSRWLAQAHEVYRGDWQVQTNSPILIVGNSHDPVTPFRSAQNNSETFVGSVLLRHDGYGVSPKRINILEIPVQLTHYPSTVLEHSHRFAQQKPSASISSMAPSLRLALSANQMSLCSLQIPGGMPMNPSALLIPLHLLGNEMKMRSVPF